MGNAEGTLSELSSNRENGEVHENWLMTPGELGSTHVTVFTASHPSSSRKRPYIERALQASKVYRHPGLLRYIDGGIISSEVVIVTERATPLHKHDLKQMPALQITAGLSAIMETLIFLHDRAGVSHNNVGASSIFVTSEGLWKLWGLDYSCSFGDLTRDHIEHIDNYCNESAIPPDDKASIFHTYQHARDCYAFAKLVNDILGPHIASDLPFAADFLSVVKNGGMNQDWSKRMRLSTLADHNFFRHDFLKLHHDLTNILLLPETNRDEFLKSLASNLKQYPEELVASTMSGSLLSHPLLLIPCAAEHLIPSVLTPKTAQDTTVTTALFSEECYKRYIVPPLLQLFTILDVTVRTVLLTHLPHYITLLPKDVLQEEILPEILLGIRDSSEVLVAATLHGLAHMVPILGGDIVIGSNRQHLFTTARPKALKTQFIGSDKGLVFKNTAKAKISKEKECTPKIPDDPEINSLDNLELDNLSISQIPERSSPDGGEDECPIPITYSGSGKEDESEAWSDWEELHDTQKHTHKQESPHIEDAENAPVSRSTSECEDQSIVKKERTKSISKTSQGFGEEYDIMAITIKKKRDSELDLFADIVPTFETKKYDLESMLEDANNGPRIEKLPSLSATLARLNSEVVDEGVGWGDDNWEDNDIGAEDLSNQETIEDENVFFEENGNSSMKEDASYGKGGTISERISNSGKDVSSGDDSSSENEEDSSKSYSTSENNSNSEREDASFMNSSNSEKETMTGKTTNLENEVMNESVDHKAEKSNLNDKWDEF